jgi:hypothetical protein
VLDVMPLVTAVDQLADRLRSAPQSRLQRGAAAEGLALARELAAWAHRLEFPGQEPREMPDVGMFAVADQVAVAGHDLAEVLRMASAEELAEAMALVEEAAQRI